MLLPWVRCTQPAIPLSWILVQCMPWQLAGQRVWRADGLRVAPAQQHGTRAQLHTHATSAAVVAAGGIRKLLVANRGEIACRVIATARKLGVQTVAIYSDVDRHAKHVQAADEAVCIGPAPARESYLRGEAVLAVAKRVGAHAVHPGYGFLSENAGFADACQQAGIVFVGPPAPAIRAMGDKAQAKAVMSTAGVPVVPGYHGDAQDDATLTAAAKDIGFPLLVKAVSGGGGKGMKLANSMEELPEALASARREAAASFGDDRLLLERYVRRSRHVEVQVVADGHGDAVYLFDRDCSVQRRHQKIIEEAPAPGLSGAFHAHIGEAAVRAAQAVGYRNAGTVEFLVDCDTSDAYFMEMNTRLQVEHPVSEAVSGVDLVEWQLVVAAGGKLPLTQQEVFHGEHVGGAGPRGHSFEARLYAESPRNNFLPGAGTVHRWRPAPGAWEFENPSWRADVAGGGPTGTYVRVDSGVREGDAVGTFYDPMIAKVITWGPDRETALAALRTALAHTQVAGLPTNLAYLQRLADHPSFVGCELDTGFVHRHADVLLAPQEVPPTVAALAGVARHLLQVAGMAGVRPPGAWGVPDSKRLWFHPTHKYRDMGVPEAGIAPAAPAADATGAGGAAASGLEVALTVKSECDFDVHVRGLPGTPASTPDGGTPAPQGAHITPPTAVSGGPARPHSHGHSTHSTQVWVRGARLMGGDRIEAEVANQRVVADVAQYAHGTDTVLCVWVGGQQYEFRWAVPHGSKDVGSVTGHASDGGQVKAPMPGRVVKVLVEEGQQVAKGTPLLLLEAMKLEHPVVAPRPGRVAGLAAAPGMQVSDGQVLMEVQDEGKAPNKG